MVQLNMRIGKIFECLIEKGEQRDEKENQSISGHFSNFCAV